MYISHPCGCSLDEQRHEISPSSGRAFGVEEAKEFFEKDYVEQITRSGSDGGRSSFRSRFHPGDFTPLWDKAVYSESDGVAAYDVAILSGRKVFAIRSKFGPSGARAEKLHVHQKLVVRRSIGSGRMSAYVLSLIPDVGCDDRRIPERFLSRGKDKGGFSGIAIYSTTDRGAVVRVQEYKDGVKVRGVYVPSGSGTYLDRCRQVLEILRGTVFMSRRNIVTRSGEDDWEDWDDEGPYEEEDPDEDDPSWVGNYIDLGDGMYTDGEGNYYADDDGDGYVDYPSLPPGYVEDEKPEEPESPPLNPDDLFPPTPPDPEPGTEDDDDDNDESDDEPSEDENDSPNDGEGLHSIGLISGGDMPDSVVYQITPQDKLARNNMPTEMAVNQTQLPATCVFSSMSYISLIHGDDVKPGEFILKYSLITNGFTFIETGVDPKYLPTLISEYFDYTTLSCTHSSLNYSSVTSALDSGDVLLGVYMTENRCLHAIVFIGYNENNKELIYVDPIDGYPHSLPESDCANLCLIYVVTEKQ